MEAIDRSCSSNMSWHIGKQQMVDPQCLERLHISAEEIRKRRNKASDTIPPVVVEFSGSPKSGKSTTIDIVSHYYKRLEFRVWAPTEGASKRTPYQLKRDLVAFNS